MPRTPNTLKSASALKRRHQRIVRARKYAISTERILQISNDISEDMCNAKASELIEVVKYFRDHFDAAWQAWRSERTQLALDLLDLAHPLLNPQAKRPNSEIRRGEPDVK